MHTYPSLSWYAHVPNNMLVPPLMPMQPPLTHLFDSFAFFSSAFAILPVMLLVQLSDLTTLAPKPFSVLSPFQSILLEITIVAISEDPHFDAMLHRFKRHVLLEGWSSLKLDHHLIDWNLTVWLVHFSKSGCKMVDELSHFPQRIMRLKPHSVAGTFRQIWT